MQLLNLSRNLGKVIPFSQLFSRFSVSIQIIRQWQCFIFLKLLKRKLGCIHCHFTKRTELLVWTRFRRFPCNIWFKNQLIMTCLQLLFITKSPLYSVFSFNLWNLFFFVQNAFNAYPNILSKMFSNVFWSFDTS